MTTLLGLIPDIDVFLALTPEELAGVLLRLAADHLQNGHIHPQTLLQQIDGEIGRSEGYPQLKRTAAELVFGEAWSWLVTHGMLVPDSGTNGSNGWMRLSRRANEVLITGTFDSYARSVEFPKSLLHPAIADTVWLDLIRGQLETAVFNAFKAVEIAVRTAGGYGPMDIGTALMRKAFDKASGTLSDQHQPEAEREALAHLFAGAIGSYKNPHSHRTVTISDPVEAREMVLLASHLLRIVDSRKS